MGSRSCSTSDKRKVPPSHGESFTFRQMLLTPYILEDLHPLSQVWLLRRYPESQQLHMAAAAVLAREAKQQEALALLADAKGRDCTLLRAQLSLDAGDAGQVSLLLLLSL